MARGYAHPIGPVPVTFQAVVNGQTLDIATINSDGTITWHIEDETLSQWDAIDPEEASLVKWKSLPGLAARTAGARTGERINLLDFFPSGWASPASGASHTLSEHYATLAAAQVDYPFVVSLNQLIDAAALHSAALSRTGSVSTSQYPGTGERAIYVPPGTFWTPAISISSITDYGGGKLLVTTSAAHPAFSGGHIALSYNVYEGVYAVDTVISDTQFLIVATFTKTVGAQGYVNQAIATNGNGQAWIGDGPVSRIQGLTIVADNSRFYVKGIQLSGTGLAGVWLQNTLRREALISHCRIRDKRSGVVGHNGGGDAVLGCNFEKNDIHIRQTTDGSHFDFHTMECRGEAANIIGIYAADSQFKADQTRIGNSAYAGMVLRRPSNLTTVENYFNLLTLSGNPNGSYATVTSVTNNGDGTITFNLSSTKKTFPGLDVTFVGGALYGGNYTVVDSTDTSVTVTTTHLGNDTGFLKLKYERIHKIASVADYSGTIAGTIKLTTGDAHRMKPLLQDATIANTTSYNGSEDIVDVVSATEVVVSATYVSSQTGDISMPNWDLIIDGVTSRYKVNDQFFTNCNINFMLFGEGGAYNIEFVGCRRKQQIHFAGACERISFFDSWRGRNTTSNSKDDAGCPDGPYANAGWKAFATRGTQTAGEEFLAMVSPNSGFAVKGTQLPYLNEVRVGETEASVWIKDVKELSVTAGQTAVSSGSALKLGNAKTGTGDVAINGYVTVVDSAGTTIKLATVA